MASKQQHLNLGKTTVRPPSPSSLLTAAAGAVVQSTSSERRGSTPRSKQSGSSNVTDTEDEEFQDACDMDFSSTMDLDTALAEAKLAINYFFNNKFDDARDLMKPWAHSSMYHSVGICVFSFLEAILTFEQQHIIEASHALKLCLNVCNRHRRKNTLTETIGKTFKKANYEQYTEVEAHAELCSAEALLLKAMLTFIEDETLTSLIKGGMKIRQCFNSYKECALILNQRTWKSESSKAHFESGVRMGMGTFNLMISLLPARVIKLLEFIGFSGNKQMGMEDLITGSQMPGIRQVLCVMTLLGYHLIVCYVLSHQEGDLNFCNEILNKQLKLYPEGVWFLFFKARLEFMKGELDEAQVWYEKSWRSQNLWPQFHHLCFWELLWVNCLKLNWRESSRYASYLLDGSKWSRTIYSYQKAAVLLMLEDKITPAERQTLDDLMRQAPTFKQRIAGKSLPMEKFICKKTERYFAQNGSLTLPAIELMYVWNTFKVMGKHFHIADSILKIIENKIAQLELKTTKEGFDKTFRADNFALTYLLKGACLRHMKSPLQSLKCLETVVALQKDIEYDTYLVPYAVVEIGLLYADQGKLESAINALEDAKKNFSGYSLESRLHFRIHTALTELKGKPCELTDSTANDLLIRAFARDINENDRNRKITALTIRKLLYFPKYLYTTTLTADEILVLSEVQNLLEIFQEATEKVSGSNYVTISLICTHRHLLISLSAYESRTPSRMGILLDPRLKKEGFESVSNAQQAVVCLEQEVTSICARTASTSVCSINDSSNSSSSARFCRHARDGKSKSCTIDSIILLRQYYERANINTSADPLLFWKIAGDELNAIKACVPKYLRISATSVESKRIFSK